MTKYEWLLSQIQANTDECLLWTGTTTKGGYGSVRLPRTRRTRLVHRLAYEMAVGPIPDGLEIDHLCHNAATWCEGGFGCIHRRCFNPKHLEPVTRRTNVLRGRTFAARNSAATHCVNGHLYDEANTYVNRNGWRCCRACHREQRRAYVARQSPEWREEQRRYLREYHLRRRAAAS